MDSLDFQSFQPYPHHFQELLKKFDKLANFYPSYLW